MIIKSRLAVLGSLSVAIMLIGTGCSSSSAPSGTTPGALSGSLEIQVGQAADSAQMAAMKEVANSFMKEHPTVKLNLVPSSPTYEDAMKVRMASGDLPDIWWTHGWSLLRYSPFLMPLQDEPWAKNLNPKLKPAMVGKDGVFYAMPVNISLSGLLYNKDVLTKAGYEPEKIKTWSDFAKAAEAIKADGVVPISVSGKANSPAGFLVNFPASCGFFTAADNQRMKKGTFVPDKYAEILNMIATWKDSGFINPDYVSISKQDMGIALAQGKTAFVFRPTADGIDALKFDPSAKIGFMPVPSNDQNPCLVGGEFDAYGIWKDTKYPDTAKAFIAFMAQPVNESKLAQATGSPAGLTDAKSNMGGLQDSYDKWVTKNNTPVQPYWDRVYTPSGFWSTMVTTADGVITKQSSVPQALDKLTRDFSRLSGHS